jgi:type IV pilus assembly protein PilW
MKRMRCDSLPSRQSGVSLIELLVAVTIGAILIFGATQVYVDSRNMYQVNEATARLQETARYALSVIEPDIRMANNWGLLKGAEAISGIAAQEPGTGLGPDTCGINFARDLATNLEGSNNAYALGCDAWDKDGATGYQGAVVSADTLTVRRAAATLGASSKDKLQICSTLTLGQLVTDSAVCTPAPQGRINDLIVNTYYVDRDSDQRIGLPSLRRKVLITGPAFRDVEVIPGVEDLQIQFGIDPTGTAGIARRYVNPAALPDGAQVVAVRIWLLVRAENPEVGFTDGQTYTYGDREGDTTTNNLSAADAATRPYKPGDNFRRLLVSRTVQIRNAMGT